MKRHQRQYSAAGGGGRQNTTSSGVSEKIRQAEKLMGEGKFALAMEQLKLAQQLQPANQYILAIMERARLLEASATSEGPGRYLSVTVGNQFQTGIKSTRAEEPPSPEQTRLRIRELTETAEILLNRGLSESAFDTLMKAYLLDPLNPDVISTEKRVLPAWEMTQRQKPGTMSGNTSTPTTVNPTPVRHVPPPVATDQGGQVNEGGFLGFFRRKR